jgi:hypothetical protein
MKPILAIVSGTHIRAGTPVLLAIIIVVGLLSVALIGGGIWLAFLGGKGDTDINIFGTTFKSRSVGVVAIFCGAVLAIFVLTRTLEALERLGAI